MKRREALRLGAVGLVGSAVAYGGASVYTRSQDGHSDPYEPLGSVDLTGTAEVVTNDAGTVAYVATTTGYATVDLSDPEKPTLLADVREPLADHAEGPLRDILDLSVSGDQLLIAGPAHDRTAELQAAMMVDVADPAEPTTLGVFETEFHIHNCILDGAYGYLCGNDTARNPLVIVDFSEPANPVEIARWSLLDQQPDWEPVDPILRYLHDIWVSEGVAVLPYWDAGTWLVDVSEPTAPTFLGRIGTTGPEDLAVLSGQAVDDEQQALPGNAHYAATDPTNTLLAVGREAWAVEHNSQLVGGPGGIELYDISDPTAPQQLSTIPAPESPNPKRDGIWTSAHNFELSTDQLYSSWYRGGMMIHDISNPTEPTRIAAWRDPEQLSFWTAQQAMAGETVVASSMGRRGSEPGVWVFPDRAGQQPDRPPLE